MPADDELRNFDVFRDCLSTPLITKSSSTDDKPPRRRQGRKKAATETAQIDAMPKSGAEDLAEFIDYISLETFAGLPAEVRTLNYTTYTNIPQLQERYALPLNVLSCERILENVEPAVTDSLVAYCILVPPASTADFFLPVLNTYLQYVTSAPLTTSQTKDLATCCEICERSWVPLTYHHLIPKFVHAKALKRGWHAEKDLNNVAWLCRACHSFVHRFAGHEELARELYTVRRLMAKDEIARFASWVGKIRWKAR